MKWRVANSVLNIEMKEVHFSYRTELAVQFLGLLQRMVCILSVVKDHSK